MTWEREIWVDGTRHVVVLSDEREALLAAKAAGRVVVGVLGTAADLSAARYLVEEPDVETDVLERVARRELGLPWRIGESERLLIREFAMADMDAVVREPEDGEDDQVFYTPELLESYIREQYGFYECGMWAVVRKSDGALLGKAGVTPGDGFLELGYHVFSPYRRMGYGQEACKVILEYVEREYMTEGAGDVREVRARTAPGNWASRRLLEGLGFQAGSRPQPVMCGGAGSGELWYVWTPGQRHGGKE